MPNIQDFHNGAHRLLVLGLAIQKAGDAAETAYRSLNSFMHEAHREVLFSKEDFETLDAARSILAKAGLQTNNVIAEVVEKIHQL